jgi:predicted Zn-dependent protease
MNTLRNIFTFIVISFFSFTITSCAINPVTGERELMLVSEQTEIEWGNNIYPNALWGEVGGGGKYHDPELEKYLERIVKDLNATSHRPNLPVDFVIQNSSVPNAWAIPGHVSMTRGLLAGLENEAQFAFIMGHEMGHVAARHSAAQMSRNILVQAGIVAAGFALNNKENSEWILGAGAIGANLFMLKYSRDQEYQSDRLGALYMSRIGYDPYESIKAHQRLDKISDEYLQRMGKNSREGSFLDEWLSTHPPMQERIHALNSAISGLPSYSIIGDGKETYTFQRITSRVRKANQAYIYYDMALKDFNDKRIREAESNLSKALQMDANQAPFYNLKGLIEIKKENTQSGLRNFEKAIDLDKNYQPAYHSMGFAHYLGKNYQEALGYLKKSLALYPENIPSHYFAGMCYFKMKNYKSAIPHLKKFASANSKHHEIHGILGICYEQVNDIASAFNAYKKQVEVAPNNEMGRYAYKRLRVLAQRLQK